MKNSDTIESNHVDTDFGTFPGVRGDKSSIARSLAGASLFSSTNQPGVSPVAVRNDPRILKHFRDNTLRMIEELATIALDLDVPTGIRLNAISEYLTRAMGKPVQAIDLNLEDRRPIVIDGALERLMDLTPAEKGINNPP